MVATRGRTFKRPWRRSCLSSKLKSSSAPIGRKDSWCFHAVGSSNAPLLGSTAAEGLPRIGRTSIATRWRSCGLPQSASCSENFVIPPDVFGQTLRIWSVIVGPAGTALAAPCSGRHYLLTDPRQFGILPYGLAGGGPNAIRSVATTRVPLAAKAAIARLIGTYGTQEVNLAKGRPQHIRKVELTVHALPKQET